MPRSVFGKALVDNRRRGAWWTLGAVGITIFVAAMFPSLRDSAAMEEMLTSFPPALMELLGIDPKMFLTGAGFLQGQLYSLVCPIAMVGFSLSMASAMTAQEEKDGSMNLLLSLPLSRSSILLQKTAALVLLTGVLAGALLLTLLVCNQLFDLRLSTSGILSANLGLWSLGLFFGCLTSAVATLTGSPALATGIAALAAASAWLAHGFANTFSWLKPLGAMSPFSWYGAHQPLLGLWSYGTLWLAVGAIASSIVAVMLFNRRDISSGMTILPEAAAALRSSKPHPLRSPTLLRSILRKTLWDRRRTIWIWVGALSALVLVTFAAWPAISNTTESMQALIELIPREMLAMFGMSDPKALATPAGFLSSRAYLTIGPIMIVVFCVSAVSKTIVREEAEGIFDLLLASAVERRQLLIQKVAAIAGMATLISLCLTLVVFLGNLIWHTELQSLHIISANLGLALLGLCYGGIALGLWGLWGARGAAMRYTAAIAVVTYFMNGIGSLMESISPLRALSPFYWYLGDTVPLGKGPQASYLLLLLVALAGTAFALRRFDKRDLG